MLQTHCIDGLHMSVFLENTFQISYIENSKTIPPEILRVRRSDSDQSSIEKM